MDRFLKIVGLIVVVWIGISLIGAVAGFVFKGLFWIALIAGGVYVVGAIAAKKKNRQINSHR